MMGGLYFLVRKSFRISLNYATTKEKINIQTKTCDQDAAAVVVKKIFDSIPQKKEEI